MRESIRSMIIVVCVSASTSVDAISIDEIDERLEQLSLDKLSYIQSRPENSIDPFTTDGCSGGMSDGWRYLSNVFPSFDNRDGNKPLWEDCCVAHDRVYWRGETDKGYMKRKQADLNLRACVVETGKSASEELARKYNTSVSEMEKSFEVAADLMYRAVRIGGKPCSGLPWRWGYGWPNCPLFLEDKSMEDEGMDDEQ